MNTYYTLPDGGEFIDWMVFDEMLIIATTTGVYRVENGMLIKFAPVNEGMNPRP